MKETLSEIQSGKFAEEWVAESKDGKKRLLGHRKEESEHSIEDVGKRLRKMMPNIDDN